MVEKKKQTKWSGGLQVGPTSKTQVQWPQLINFPMAENTTVVFFENFGRNLRGLDSLGDGRRVGTNWPADWWCFPQAVWTIWSPTDIFLENPKKGWNIYCISVSKPPIGLRTNTLLHKEDCAYAIAHCICTFWMFVVFGCGGTVGRPFLTPFVSFGQRLGWTFPLRTSDLI